MFKRTKLSASLLLAFGGGLIGVSYPVLAQQALDRVEVTGSRIASPNAESPSPLQVITSEEIAASGVTNLQDLLLKNPVFGSPPLSRTNSSFFTTGAGQALIDLRNLGEARTLVLVNGKRFVSGVPGSSAVDLNSIPTEFIERVEILTGGASSVYGSDAVAGVVNIILKRDFEGLAFSAQVGQSEYGDNKSKRFGVTFGATAAEGRGNVMGYIGYSDEGSVLAKDRKMSATDNLSLSLFTGEVSDIFTRLEPFYSSFAPQGRFFLGGSNYTFDRDGNIIPFSTNGPAGDGVGATGFNRSAFRYIAVPVERFLFSSKGDYAITDKHQAFFEATYSAASVKAGREPYPLDSVTDIYNGGRTPAEFLVNGVAQRNPLIPQALFDLMTDTDGDGLRDYTFTRRMAEFGTRNETVERDLFRYVVGLKGEVTSSINYEVYAGYGMTKELQVGNGQVNVLNFKNALEAIIGPDGTPICRDPLAQAQGCVPVNVFGFDAISPEAAAYIRAPSSLNTKVTQKIYGASLSGEPLKAPAGPIGVAAGVEYRSETSRAEFDALSQAGLNAGNVQPNTYGDFSVSEAFVETRVPLIKDQPFAKRLDFSAAVRAASYSTVGGTTSWNAGLEWAPVNDVKVRATRSLATRAPNISELFTAPSENFEGAIDPCEGVTATSTGEFDDRCRADPSVAANIAANGSFTLTQADRQGVGGFDSGNPDLKEEEGKTWTLGIVWTPSSIKNLALTLDYFNVEIDDGIVPLPRQFIAQQCYSSAGDASFCDLIRRRPADTGTNSIGSLDEIDSPTFNSGGIVTEGIDITASYGLNVGPGRLDGRLAYTYLLEGYEVPTPGADRNYFRGEFGAPKHKANLTLVYKWGDFSLTNSTTVQGKQSFYDDVLAGFGKPRNSVGVKEKIYNDMQLTYAPAKGTEVYFGIDNVFDTKAPYIDGNLAAQDTIGSNTFASSYDPIGRRYYAGLRMKF